MISFAELFIIVIITLMVFGPKRLPQFAQRLGKLWSSLHRFNEEMHAVLDGEVMKSQLEKNIAKAKQADSHYGESET